LVRLYENKDNGFLWAAYLKGSFDLPEGLTQAEFLPAVAEKWGGFPLVYVIEDENKGFKSGKGIVALVPVWTDGWVYEPTVKFFGWATKKNILRASVAFFQMLRHEKSVGVCVVKTTKKDFRFMKHMEKYGVLYVRGRVPRGCAEGDVFVFSIEGKK
jgi:hypothetical protein